MSEWDVYIKMSARRDTLFVARRYNYLAEDAIAAANVDDDEADIFVLCGGSRAIRYRDVGRCILLNFKYYRQFGPVFL